MTQLHRYTEAPNDRRLSELLVNPSMIETEAVGADVTLDDFDQAAELGLADPERSTADIAMAETLHGALRGSITRRDAADMQLWHWFAVSCRPNLVWRRWTGAVPGDPKEALTASLATRFLGPPTLHGVSRNTFARLWWCAETLYSDDTGYELMNAALHRQDLFQAVFERRFGLHAPTAAAFIRRFAEGAQAEWRQAAKRLDYRLGTIVLEALTGPDVQRLLDAVAVH